MEIEKKELAMGKIAEGIMEIIEVAMPEIKGMFTLEFIPISAEPREIKKETLSDKIRGTLYCRICPTQVGPQAITEMVTDHIYVEEIEQALKEFIDSWNGRAGVIYPHEIKEKAKEHFGERLIK